MTPPLLLVTNDDGVHSPGIRALASALEPIGEVHVVAPDRETSACSHSLSLRHPLRVKEVGRQTFAVDGTPADCVNLALVSLLNRRPSLVLSGINLGANLSDDIFYSGTVGGAREATFFSLPAIAVSLASRGTAGLEAAAGFAARLAARVLKNGLPERTLLNVNVPAGEPTRAVMTVQSRREHAASLQPGIDARRRAAYWTEAAGERWEKDEMSDVHAVRAGFISVTPLQTDTTHHAALERLRSWEPDLVG